MEKKNYPVFLPKTDFAMRANLAEKEKDFLNFWQEIDIYTKLRNKSEGRKKFILHFGPPYANGNIHIGHALTYILKDIVNKLYQMSGYDAPMVPGWDCHGLPIEWKVEEEYKTKGLKKEDVNQLEFIKSCRDFAKNWMNIQKGELKRLGVIADWNDPYCTMDFESEALIANELSKFLMQGNIYRGLKPVMWSVVEKTALAEAEVEYKDHVSDSIFVKFPIVKTKVEQLKGSSAVIWTTTPWTIPANRAIAYGKDFEYVLITNKNSTELLSKHEKFVVAKDLQDSFCKKIGIEDFEIISTFKGSDFEGSICNHPLHNKGYSFEVPFVEADHVTTESGTGLVHTAPSHGVEDFLVGKKYNLEVPEIVQGEGVYASSVPVFAGMHIYKVNPVVIEELKKSCNLLFHEKFTHSYPHSWRSKAPLIYRAASQWFISMDKNDLRQKALNAIDDVKWVPQQGKNRIKAMVENRPDWCLSRQRIWGMPITFFVSKNTGEPIKDDKINQRIVDAIKKDGIEAWHIHDKAYFLKDDYAHDEYEKIYDILDVWFESGCTHAFVLEQRKELQAPADLYFEGSDQHRGWFQSSLINSCATRGKAPYKTVCTHGFTLDEKGYKMSKSQGNVIAPQQIVEKVGADMLRLWVTLSDYQEDIRIGQNILKHNEDVYRKIRNTIRYLLGALEGFDEKKDLVNHDEMPDLEKYILHKLKILEEKRNQVLENYDFATFYNDLHNFCANDLSAFYFDIRKDCLYCDALDNSKRKSSVTVMYHLWRNLSLWLAPVLSFTAEESWQAFYGKKSSIHLEDFIELPKNWYQQDLFEHFEFLREIRKVITGAIELERSSKTLGSSLQAHITIYASSYINDKIKDVDWAEISIVSKANLVVAKAPSNSFILDDVKDVGVVVNVSSDEKCQRCWQFKELVTEDLCLRCDEVVKKYEN